MHHNAQDSIQFKVRSKTGPRSYNYENIIIKTNLKNLGDHSQFWCALTSFVAQDIELSYQELHV